MPDMAHQLVITMVVILTGITAISILFLLLSLTAIALNKLFPVTQTANKIESGTSTPSHVSEQTDEETVAVIQAAIATHLRRSAQ